MGKPQLAGAFSENVSVLQHVAPLFSVVGGEVAAARNHRPSRRFWPNFDGSPSAIV
jgi:hypothetical protein